MKFLIKIYSNTFLLFSLSLLFYVTYQSEITYDGVRRDYYWKYQIISFFLILFSILTFYLNKKIKEYLIIISISFIFSLYLFESYLSFKFRPNINNSFIEKKIGKKIDRRTKLQIYEDLRKIDKNVSIHIGPAGYINDNNKIFPLSSLSNSKTIFCNENGYYSIFKHDRYGFNNPDETWDNEKINYMLIGDSFVHGACVNRPNDIASLLRNYSDKSVLNLGYGGNGPLINYATLREYLAPNVKNILWFYYEGNDLKNLDSELSNKILKTYLYNLNFTQNLKYRQKEIDNLTKKMIQSELNILKNKYYKFNKLKYEIKNFIKIYHTRSQFTPSPKPKAEFIKVMNLVNKTAKENGSKLYFVYLPEYKRYIKNYNNESYLLIKNIISDLNIPFIDIHEEIFEKEENPLNLFPFGLPGHYNEKGYKKISKSLYKLTR